MEDTTPPPPWRRWPFLYLYLCFFVSLNQIRDFIRVSLFHFVLFVFLVIYLCSLKFFGVLACLVVVGLRWLSGGARVNFRSDFGWICWFDFFCFRSEVGLGRWCSGMAGDSMLSNGCRSVWGCRENDFGDAIAYWSNGIWITGCFRWYLKDRFLKLRYYGSSSSPFVIQKLRLWQELIPVRGSSLCGSCCRSNRVITVITCSSRDLVLVLLLGLMCPVLHIWSFVPFLSLVAISMVVKTGFLIILLASFSVTGDDVGAAVFRCFSSLDRAFFMLFSLCFYRIVVYVLFVMVEMLLCNRSGIALCNRSYRCF